ncbi:MAG: hypothetical protein OJF48_000284 [Afipia sp.]|nr:MAG: hypothetical protein OJF48_000284 [Afipia sp.]
MRIANRDADSHLPHCGSMVRPLTEGAIAEIKSDAITP